MLTFWFDRGVDGFRVDAVTVVGKHPGLPDAPPPDEGAAETDVWAHNPYTVFWPSAHDDWRHWRALVDDYERDASRSPARHGQRGVHRQAPRPAAAVRAARPVPPVVRVRPHAEPVGRASMIRESVADAVDALVPAGASLAWTLNNHDTQRAVTRYGRADATSPASWTGNNLVYTDARSTWRSARAVRGRWCCSPPPCPGTLYLYQGEELGLPEVLDIPDDATRRTRSSSAPGTRDRPRRLPRAAAVDGVVGERRTASPSGDVEPWLPQPEGWGSYAIGPEHDSETSMLTLYQRILRSRNCSTPWPPLEWVAAGHDDVLAFRRGDVTVVLNVSPEPGGAARRPRRRGRGAAGVLGVRRGHGTVPGDATVWLRT